MIPFISRSALSEQAVWVEELSKAMPHEEIALLSELTAEQKQDCDVAIVANPDPQDLLELPSLRWVHSVWAGVERMVQKLSSPRFSIVRLVDPNLAATMSEAVLAWTLFLHRDMPTYAQQQSKKQWIGQPMVFPQDRRIGVLGLGELGKLSAQRLANNGFSVSGWSRNQKQVDGVSCLHGESGLISLLSQSDIIVCLLPLTAQTKGLLNRERLAHLPVGASIINFARGPIIDDDALLERLDCNALSHAVLDVFMQEPLPQEHRYWEHPSVSVLPHISAPTSPSSASSIVAKNINHYRLTAEIPLAVDPVLGY
ncbi:glyoxylate/hydroxypyruvate reductase A [Marinomonas alcarazii]|uniref:Glyoxylate/hydroxypyruvate reductase A n=1 Tax=Marinomonas alcarazii TaxID=491949 RepID=A0A318VCC3_9GAMM|nr:glyoxylate/hydroxypyruvate reductase A [Marinomonas alcarazii]PYF84015.1 glyoxylate/hydroxypyruvate reductase A [Marinomonas alcarazii]